MKEKKLSILKKMVHLQPKQLRKYVRNCESDLILVSCECLHNVLLGHIRVKIRDLEKYRDKIESVLKKKSSMDKRRALFLTKIGFELFKLLIKFCFILLSYTMTTAEEFILIHKNQFMKEQPYTPKFLNDPSVQHTGAQLSFLDRMRPNEYTNKRNGHFLYKGNN